MNECVAWIGSTSVLYMTKKHFGSVCHEDTSTKEAEKLAQEAVDKAKSAWEAAKASTEEAANDMKEGVENAAGDVKQELKKATE